MARLFDDANFEYLFRNAAPISGVPLTISAWFNTDDNGTGSERIVSLGTSSDADAQFSLRFASSQLLLAFHHDGTSGNGAIASGSYSLNTWQHACGVFAATNSRTCYLNGNAGSESTSTISDISPNRTSIGAEYDISASRYLSGSVAEVGIWNVALTSGEISILALGYSPLLIRPQSLVAYWPLIGKPISSAEIDLIGQNNLTLQNSPSNSAHPRVYYPVTPLLTLPQKDNITDSIGRTFATDEVFTPHYQKVKIFDGTADESDLIIGNTQGLYVQGQIADDEISAGDPVLVSGDAKAQDGTDPGSVVESDTATIITNLNRIQSVNTSHPNFWSVNENHTSAQTNNQLKAAPGAGLSLYVESINVTTSIAMNIKLVEDTGGTPVDVAGPYYLTANGQMAYTFSPPIKITADTDLGFTSTAGNNHTINVSGYIGV